MLFDVLESLFSNNGYQIIQKINLGIHEYTASLAVPLPATQRQEYFLLLEHTSIDTAILRKLIDEDAVLFYNLLADAEFTDEAFKKNCTLVLGCDCSDEAKVSSDVVLTVEEDPYNFKKNIITYTQSELQSWTGYVKSPLTVEYLNQLINAEFGEKFKSYKNSGGNSGDYYCLLMKIVAKIPIIRYLPPSKDLLDLEREIRKSIPGKDLAIFDLLQRIDLKLPDEELEEALLGDWSNNELL